MGQAEHESANDEPSQTPGVKFSFPAYLGQSLNLCMLLFPHVKSGVNNSEYLTMLL